MQRRGERIGERGFRAVRALQPVQHRRLELGLGRAVPEPGERGGDLGASNLPSEWNEWRVGGARAQHDLLGIARGVQEPRVVAFREVVVVARDPEHGNHGHLARPFEPPCQGDRRQRLVDRVEGTGEETWLLAGRDDEHLTRRQPLATRPGRGGGDHAGVHAPRRESRRRQRERCDRSRDDARNHSSLVTRPRRRLLEKRIPRSLVPATRPARDPPCAPSPQGTLPVPNDTRSPPAGAATP